MTTQLTDETQRGIDDMRSALSIHDAALEAVFRVILRSGVAPAIDELRRAWLELTAPEDRSEEFERMVVNTLKKVLVSE